MRAPSHRGTPTLCSYALSTDSIWPSLDFRPTFSCASCALHWRSLCSLAAASLLLAVVHCVREGGTTRRWVGGVRCIRAHCACQATCSAGTPTSAAALLASLSALFSWPSSTTCTAGVARPRTQRAVNSRGPWPAPSLQPPCCRPHLLQELGHLLLVLRAQAVQRAARGRRGRLGRWRRRPCLRRALGHPLRGPRHQQAMPSGHHEQWQAADGGTGARVRAADGDRPAGRPCALVAWQASLACVMSHWLCRLHSRAHWRAVERGAGLAWRLRSSLGELRAAHALGKQQSVAARPAGKCCGGGGPILRPPTPSHSRPMWPPPQPSPCPNSCVTGPVGPSTACAGPSRQAPNSSSPPATSRGPAQAAQPHLAQQRQPLKAGFML